MTNGMYIRSRRLQLVTLATLLAFTFAFGIPKDAMAQNNPVQRTTSSVLVTGAVAGGGVFNGVLKVTSVAANAVTGALTATGNLSGTVTNSAGQVVGTVTNQAVNVPLASVSGSCTILTLTLGPVDLNLLGLMVHLNQVVLNITAQPGPGNLLGNLLCSIAGLLNGGGLNNLLTQIVGLINQLLGSL